MKGFLLTYRVLNIKQWTKNLLIFIPLIFAESYQSISSKPLLLIAVFSFCLLTSAIYLLNDIIDLEDDKNHITKRNRPLASGEISKKQSIICLIILLVFGCVGLTFYSSIALFLGLAYVINNLIYSFWLKKIPFLDLILLLIGYSIRLLLGGVISHAPLTTWLFTIILVVATYLIAYKRKSDVLLNKSNPRTKFYKKINTSFVIKVLTIVIISLYACYIIFEFFLKKNSILSLFTIPLAATGLYLYYKSMTRNPHQDPLDVLLKNKLFFICVLNLNI